MLRNLLCVILAWLAFAPAAQASGVFDLRTTAQASQLIAAPTHAERRQIVDDFIGDASEPADPFAWVSDAPTFDVAFAPAGRLRMGRVGTTPPPVTDQTAYWGPKTLVGNGGYSVAGLAPGAVLSAPDTANYYWDATNRWIVPKLGANKTYNLSRGGSPLPASEVFTITDSAGTVFTVDNRADVTRAGNYTWRWRNGDNTSSTTGTNQLFQAWKDSVYGDHLAMRGGTTLNTTADCATGCSPGSTTLFNGTQGFRLACSVGNCQGQTGFTGSNYRVVRSELGYTNTIGPISFEGSGLGSARIVGFNIDGEDPVYDAYLIASVGGAQEIVFENLHIIGDDTDPTARNRPSALQICLDCKAQVLNSTIEYVRNGISTQHGLGTVGDVFAGSVAPNSGAIVISGNYIREVGRDSFASQCPRYVTFENNIFTDQKTEINVGTAVSSPPWVNPFSSGSQPHSDKIQLNYQNSSTNVCAYNYYPGIIFRNNFFGRGDGRDSLPFWTTPPFPNPNNTGTTYGSGIPAEAATPNPAVSGGDSQGLFASNYIADCPAVGPGCTTISRKLVAGTTPRTYAATLDVPDIRWNIITSVFSSGINLPPVRDGFVAYNSVIGPRVATSTNLETWSGFGNSGLSIWGLEGSPVVAQNTANTSSIIAGNSSPPASQVVEVPLASYGTVYNDPTAKLSPRTPTEFRLYYRPLPGTALELSPGVYAGAVCPDGSVNTGTCP